MVLRLQLGLSKGLYILVDPVFDGSRLDVTDRVVDVLQVVDAAVATLAEFEVHASLVLVEDEHGGTVAEGDANDDGEQTFEVVDADDKHRGEVESDHDCLEHAVDNSSYCLRIRLQVVHYRALRVLAAARQPYVQHLRVHGSKDVRPHSDDDSCLVELEVLFDVAGNRA